MAEHGLEGSQYGATVLSCLPDGHVYVEYDALNEDGMESDILLREWVAADLITPPPPPAPTGFGNALTIGSPVQFLHDAGWWTVILSGHRMPTALEPTDHLVRSLVYNTCCAHDGSSAMSSGS